MDAGGIAALSEADERASALTIGGLVPFFIARGSGGAQFQLHSAAGRYILLGFIGSSTAPAAQTFLAEIEKAAELFDGVRAAALTLSIDPSDEARLRPNIGGWRALLDPEGAISRRYGVKREDGYRPSALLLDRTLRVLAGAPLSQARSLIDDLRARLEQGGEAASLDHAPVLLAPRILDPELCGRLIEHFLEGGAEPSGFMREIDGRTVLVSDPSHKSRSDAAITDEGLRLALAAALRDRLAPLIERAWGWKATRIERYIVARYSAAENGRFGPHRDNMTKGTAHRKFAVSINLNDDFDGGDLRFPEFGMRTYRAPVGGAVVFGCRVLHEATPMTRGERYATLPFLYDDKGAKVRAANAQFVDVSPR